MNHLTLCSNNNHLWYPWIVIKYKVHVSFITFILEDEYRLSLGMLMHVKCIHELCIIILIFQSYLYHIRVISWFYNDFGNISQFPYFLELTLHWQKALFSIFWCFRDPNDVQMTWKFTSIGFMKEEDLGAKEANERRPEAQKGVAHAARFLGHVGPPSGASWLRCRRSFLPRPRLDLKTDYKNSPPT